MKKFIVSAGIVFLLNTTIHAQEAMIMATPSKTGMSIEHEVMPKETLYSLSRKYHAKVSDIAAANGFDVNKGLLIGEKVNIPLTADNFNQKTEKGAPVYYQVGDGEGLLSVSKKFNKISLQTLKKWNNLKSDNVNKSSSLIVGYLSNGVAATDKKSTVKTQTPKPDTKKPEAATAVNPKPDIKNEKAVSEKPKKEKASVKAVQPKKEEEQKAIVEKPTSQEGFFKNMYTNQSHKDLRQVMNAGVFKTNSGWGDYKYYLLMDALQPGTVVKLTNPENNAVVYAKVLGGLSDVQQDAGIDVRISDAAASILQVKQDSPFTVSVQY